MIGFAVCGSFCCHEKAIGALAKLNKAYPDILPIMSDIAYFSDTKFGKSEDMRKKINDICKKDIVHTIVGAEPIGPKGLLDCLVICPCTGNTLSKMAHGICDTSVTMAAKAQLRNERPVVIALATNDGLAANAASIGILLRCKNVYFVPFGEDDPEKKPRSLMCDFSLVKDTVDAALRGVQLQPIIREAK